jgi:hypothetical protein
MADDPMTVDAVVLERSADLGVRVTKLKVSGPADYDATNGSAFDISTYTSNVYDVQFGGVTAKADALVIPRYVNADWTDATAGLVYFTWDEANDGATQAARALANVADTTDLSGYQWYVTTEGAPP